MERANFLRKARPKAEPERTLRVLFEIGSNFRVCRAQVCSDAQIARVEWGRREQIMR